MSNYAQPSGRKKNSNKTALVIILCIFGFSALMGILFGEEEPKNITSETGSTLVTSSETESQEESYSKPSQNTLKENTYTKDRYLTNFNGVKATFMEVCDPNIGVTALQVKINLENNGNEEVTVLPIDGYVNDTAVQFMSGFPVTIAPGKKAVGVYTFGYNDLGFSKVEDIEKMEFKLGLMNSSWSEVKKSEIITIVF